MATPPATKQVIFEWNTVRPGGAEVSWGSNLDNYSPGYCQHVYHAHNHFQVAALLAHRASLG